MMPIGTLMHYAGLSKLQLVTAVPFGIAKQLPVNSD